VKSAADLANQSIHPQNLSKKSQNVRRILMALKVISGKKDGLIHFFTQSNIVAGVIFELMTLCHNRLDRFFLGLISSYGFFSHFGGA
jgi:hypothetical protein